jgi:hypothetical protein
LSLEIVSGWKEIANYLRKGVRTVQRYERALALPVRRPAGKANGAVIATKAELDAWVTTSPLREAFRPHPAVKNAVVLNEFRRQLQELRRLRDESAVLRQELHGAVELLQENLRCRFSRQSQTPESSLIGRPLADVVASNPSKNNVN